MKRFVLIAFLFSCTLFPYPVFAQDKTVPATRLIDSLYAVLKIQKDDTNKVNTLNRLSFRHEILSNYDSALSYAERAQTLAEKIGFKEGLADAFRNTGMVYFDWSNYQKALEYQYKSFILFQDIGNKKGIATALSNIGLVYYTLGNYSKALECYFKGLTVAQKIEDKNIIGNILCNIGLIYVEQGNYNKALEYLFNSLGIQIDMENKNNIAVVLDDIGDIYLLQSDYTKALEYNFRAVAQAQEVGDKEAIASALGDIGNIYYKQGDYTRALEYDFKAVIIVREIGDIDEVANISSNTGGVYIKLKNYKQAKNFLDSALNFSKKIGSKKYIENTYKNLATLDSTTGDYKTAYNDYKKYMAYRDSINNQETTQIELSYEFEKREDSIRAEYKQENIIKTAEINRKKIINESAIALLGLTVLLALLLINRQQIKNKKNKLFFEKEKQQMENELSTAKAMLDDYIKNMMGKNKLLEQFKADIEKLKNLKSKELEEVRIEQLEHLNKTTILTEEDWDKFQELFEQVYKGFFIRLKEKLPDLSQAEIRLVCLTKLKLNTKQMADTLGVSRDAIRKTHQRLRKKLDLSENKDIVDIIESI